jgi:hypothetical protein
VVNKDDFVKIGEKKTEKAKKAGAFSVFFLKE